MSQLAEPTLLGQLGSAALDDIIAFVQNYRVNPAHRSAVGGFALISLGYHVGGRCSLMLLFAIALNQGLQRP